MSSNKVFGKSNCFRKLLKKFGITPRAPIRSPMTSKLLRSYLVLKYGIVGSYIIFFSWSTSSDWSAFFSYRMVGSIIEPILVVLEYANISTLLVEPFVAIQLISSSTSQPFFLKAEAMRDRTWWWRALRSSNLWSHWPWTWARVSVSGQPYLH